MSELFPPPTPGDIRGDRRLAWTEMGDGRWELLGKGRNPLSGGIGRSGGNITRQRWVPAASSGGRRKVGRGI